MSAGLGRSLASGPKVTGGTLPLSCVSSVVPFQKMFLSFLKHLPRPDTTWDMEESEWDPKEEEEQGPGDKTTSSEVTEKDQRC